ncbi:MAG: DctP family TRAP transporter solute-binding subunit [Hydrogenophaga sp.]|uniref:DctP family TRAP transporter solute-binding subunit n=1 Tax=Hydrogenophaga sp. TaxID=1904254 RepID=UPI0025C5E9A3|nr:DctP family TRAP transporter solute-binding subunit [Hydrogenophaga sp.]MBT9553153.1 DctP family TRAP transporter solute-binding subunit [Hydrogenophaga sp.]
MSAPPVPRSPRILRRAVLGAACALAGGWAGAARPAVLLRFSHVVAPDTPKGQMALRFQSLVHARAGGRIRVEVHPASQLWGDDDEMEALRLGAVEMLAPSLSKFGMAGVPEFEVFDLPYLFADLAQVRRVTQGEVGRGLLQRLGRQQMLGLGFLDNGFKQMSAARPLRTPTDYRGLRVRVQASRVLGEQVRALGAQPVVLPFGETQRALASGVVDAAENPLSNFLTQGLAALQPHLTLTQHGYLGYAVVSHPRFWASLPSADRELLSEALAEALAHGNRLAAELDAQALATLRRTPGLQVHGLTPAERSALRRHLQTVYDGFQRSLGSALLKDVQQALDQR